MPRRRTSVCPPAHLRVTRSEAKLAAVDRCGVMNAGNSHRVLVGRPVFAAFALGTNERANGPSQPMIKDLAAVNQVLDRFVPNRESALSVGAWIAASADGASEWAARRYAPSVFSRTECARAT